MTPSLLARPWHLAASLLLLSGCGGGEVTRETPPTPFVFRSLNLRQQDVLGRPNWELTSPEARYDLRRRVARALRPRGVIYSGGKPAYRVEASTGTVINDGAVILLEGRIRLQRLGSAPVMIQGSRVRWLPSRNLMEIDRHPEGFDPHTRLSAERATFRIDKDTLELQGKPQLKRWSQAFDPFLANPVGSPQIVVTVASVLWQPGSGALTAGGPVLGERRPPGSAAGAPLQTLTATSLNGNTQTQLFNLGPPVLFKDPAVAGGVSARGKAMQVDAAQKLVRIPVGCLIEQAGASLQARSCAWNWQTQAIAADGSVLLQRPASRQLTRGSLLRGQLGEKGSVIVTAPGGRVFSQFQVPPSKTPPRPAPPRPKPEPIRL
ncbi:MULTISPECIES: LPS export ABC transporter periplasmic protein LptC [unclassified Cyanobium]|uniref:LPS export ABC transporter periplasmic protein LptC n=1 Tax=unclassified Cyanobium TaxID=2627006 RepID=UPI0020CF677A|nr:MULTISPECIES: LPS export ABC transporter periplasmic protein LptC [unclassified Cyanobium]MCP9833142.1 LPS export ABC transporter periplasmic protein LptC [Cyanobium sp. La Preciosa 7G6]MCP9935995.1 LPS export ABC transporter periplasmic protein LptC [Cyanobium sp. Aljojuca 7A6]